MEGIVELIDVHDKEVCGCVRHNSDIMLSFTIEDKDEIHDIFLTQEQAEKLSIQLITKIRYNIYGYNIC